TGTPAKNILWLDVHGTLKPPFEGRPKEGSVFETSRVIKNPLESLEGLLASTLPRPHSALRLIRTLPQNDFHTQSTVAQLVFAHSTQSEDPVLHAFKPGYLEFLRTDSKFPKKAIFSAVGDGNYELVKFIAEAFPATLMTKDSDERTPFYRWMEIQ